MFLSQQVKRNVIITNKNGKYELSDEFPNDVSLKKKSQNSMELWSSAQLIVNIRKKLLKTRYCTFPPEQYFT